VGGRVYTRAILHTGAAMKLSDAWHGTPVATPAAMSEATGEVAGTSSPDTRADERRGLDRRLVVAATVATAIGAVVIALSGDVIIAIAVAAAVYALSDRALKAWGSSTSRPPARQERVSH
jgi:hypothetical protein